MRALCLLLLTLLAACDTGSVQYLEAPGQDDDALRTAAAEAWATVGVEAPEDYSLLFLDRETLTEACHAPIALPDGSELPPGGCSFPGVVLVSTVADFARQQTVLIHELGHIMRGEIRDGELDHAHLDCPETAGGQFLGRDVMCMTGAPAGQLPTIRDIAFVAR